MARTVGEWIGKSDDSVPPPRVKLRVLAVHQCRCAQCFRRLDLPGVAWELDHAFALANGGPNRESNLQPLCSGCHVTKTGKDVAEKSRVVRKRMKHLGLYKPRGRPLPGTKRSGLRKHMDGRVTRR